MKNKGKKTKYRLIAASSVLILIILIGFLGLRRSGYTWEMEAEDALAYVISGDYTISPEEVRQIIESDAADYLIVDLRSPYDYVKGHLQGAVNIPYESLLEESNLEFFEDRDSEIIIFYGKNQLQANGPMLLLKQIGFDDLKVMLGGYDYYSSNKSLDDTNAKPAYLVEEPRYDFARIVSETAGSEMVKPDVEQPENIIPVRRKKKTVVEGGC